MADEQWFKHLDLKNHNLEKIKQQKATSRDIDLVIQADWLGSKNNEET